VQTSPPLRPDLPGAPPGPVALAGLGLCWTMTASYAATGTVGTTGEDGHHPAWMTRQ
jgi:hypothetical protein